MFPEIKIVIIGAGASGVAAASKLIENGFKNVTVLEAKNRIGGRIYTKDFADNVVEMGAQWVHGEEDNIVFEMASKHNLIEYDTLPSFTFFTSKGEQIPQSESDKILEIYDNIDNNPYILNVKFKSYGEIFTREFYHMCRKYNIANEERLKEYLAWLYKINCSIQCCDTLFEVSAKKLRDYKNCPGDLLINWKTNGYKSLLDLFVNNYSNNSKELNKSHIQLEKQVKLIDYNSGNDVLITTTDGTKYNATHVIFTPSLGVLKAQHSTLFKPLLPERKICAIENLGISTVNKIFLEFPDRWWPLDVHRLCLLWTKEDEDEFVTIYGNEYRWLCNVYYFISLPYQPRVLCGWLVGPSARYSESLTDSEATKQLYILLQRFFSKMYNVSEPISMIRSRWFNDECFRGSYTFQSTDTEKNDVSPKQLAEPVTNDNGIPVLLFAGEATHDYYYSTVHGAIETGFREADRIIKHYK